MTIPFQRLDRTAGFPYSAKEYARRFAWEMVQATVVRHSFRRAHGWRRMWLGLFGCQMTRTSLTKATTRIMHPWLLKMGEHCALAEGVTVYNLGLVTIGDHTVVSQNVHICAGTHDYTKADLPLIRPPIVIGNGVWVCADAFIGPGVTIGDNSVVGARAVVMKDVPAGMVVAGNPARVIKTRKMDGAQPQG